MKMELWIFLPDGKSFRIWQTFQKEHTEKEFEDAVAEYRRTFGSFDALNVDIVNENGNQESLILWGNVLKNSYVRVKRI